ncbi:M23 family metallopeptidase [Paracrocinitomix mangrovi]|uniref:M23 family metallopeptidase n=1 Tax=Paracrocinitomix mangrovi TaxID=2862509 RepID=UPI001C8D87DC|nr:M23 family metallopeptidase [Paracrocinitomix mangrovi]UKN00893.1 M23 family metallopeptidase [Paracrocinitomix mangrovi]
MKYLFMDPAPTASVEQINDNSRVIDSLKTEIESRQKYFNDLQMILTDQPFEDSLKAIENDTLLTNYEPHFDISEEDSLLREKFENQSSLDEKNQVSIDFYSAPVKGTVSKSFDRSQGHYGVDVVTEKGAPIKSCLDGTVIFSAWSQDDGMVVIVQHSGELISVYKHCSSLLKKIGDKIQTTDPIAIVGSTGAHSSGPHLHFELWKRGIPLNPQEFINFSK